MKIELTEEQFDEIVNETMQNVMVDEKLDKPMVKIAVSMCGTIFANEMKKLLFKEKEGLN